MLTQTSSRRARTIHAVSMLCLFVGFGCADSSGSNKPSPSTPQAVGLIAPVEILRDRWGIAHIYAENQHDLFYAQGYSAARDRLFQLELWRRRVSGEFADLTGPVALDRDIGARLLRPELDLDEELRHYHPDGPEIVGAFVDGINAFIEETRVGTRSLPFEFALLGIEPGTWTPEIVISRIGGLFFNIEFEEAMVHALAETSGEELARLGDFQPGMPDLTLLDGISSALFPLDVLRLYSQARNGIMFTALSRDALAPVMAQSVMDFGLNGSNGWILSGDRTGTGSPILANDPHRLVAAPSLRYVVHLVAPGWNVIGAGEPHLPGVAIGHNEVGAWGLTVFPTDSEDLYVYDTNPDNENQYRYQDAWEDMRISTETIRVRGESDREIVLKRTRHGPVLFEDPEQNRAYALRASWLEVGSAPYLASLRFDQAQSWEEFREACQYFRAPSENMLWADVDGHIGWQAVGAVPIRDGWSGLLPVPGDGRYEWQGEIPPLELPHMLDPPSGVFATANELNLPEGYPYDVGFLWEDRFRFQRIEELLAGQSRFSVEDMATLQHDELSIPARELVPLLEGRSAQRADVETARLSLLNWDFVLDADATEPTIFTAWLRHLQQAFVEENAPGPVAAIVAELVLDPMVLALSAETSEGEALRDRVLLDALTAAVDERTERLGADQSTWVYGQPRVHHSLIFHPLSLIGDRATRSKVQIGPEPRGGDGYTVNLTFSDRNQFAGATFRMVADTSDWDRSIATNAPGQSGDPDSDHYSDLFGPWIRGEYFPLTYSRSAVEAVTEEREVMLPR